MAAKAVVVFNSAGQPVVNAEVSLGLRIGLTNKDGYILFQDVGTGLLNMYVRVLATNYKVVVTSVNLDNQNQTIRLGNPQKEPNDILLPALSFNKPSRESIVNVKANLCNLRDADDIPIFEPFISRLITSGNPKAEDWFSRLKAAGSTHINVFLTGDYNENLGWAPRYPINGVDFTNHLDDFASVLEVIKAHNLIPIIKLGFDGQHFDPEGWTYGWQWGMDNLERIVIALHNSIEDCLWSTGFDGCFPDWSPDQTLQMLRYMRVLLGEDACIDTEFSGPGTVGYCHLGNGAADWTADKLGILDHFSIELLKFPPDNEGVGQTATRLLGPKCLIGPKEPYYLEGLEKYIAINFYETCAYQAIRKLIKPQDATIIANYGKSYGFSVFGNGIPSV